MVVYLVEALYFKLEGHGFISQWGHYIFTIYVILPAALRPWDLLSHQQKQVPENLSEV
jgi:hypothetical protein